MMMMMLLVFLMTFLSAVGQNESSPPRGAPQQRTFYFTPEQEERVKNEIICVGERCLPPMIPQNKTLPEGDPKPRVFFLTPEQEERVKAEIICRGIQCIPFHVVSDKSDQVQERHYGQLDVVTSTSSSCSNFSSASRQGYSALYRYRHGNNTDNRQLRSSTPVVIEVTDDSSGNCTKTFKVWYYVPKRIAASPPGLPKPVEDNLEIGNVQSLDVYVHTFTGKGDKPESEVDTLKENLKKLNLCVKNNKYYVALYDPPARKQGRRNEIWLEKQPC